MISKFNTVILQQKDLFLKYFDFEGESSMYLIADGTYQFKIKDEKRNVRLDKLLRSGDYFSEITLIFDFPKSTTI